MSRRSPKIYLLDIIESINYIQAYIEGVSKEEFFESVEKQDAVLRRLEIIGEAVKQIPGEIRDKYIDIPWREIAGLRDIIIHQYYGVTLEMVWLVITEEIVPLKANINEIIQSY